MNRYTGECRRTWVRRVTELFRVYPAVAEADTTAAYIAEAVRWSA